MDGKRGGVRGYDVSASTTIAELVLQAGRAGFNATELGRAVGIVGEMKKAGATVFLAFTSNMASSGLRELFAGLCKRKFVDAVVTGIGSVEEDVMKIQSPFVLASFGQDDAKLHEKGINRIGNILVPDERYEKLERLDREFYSGLFEKFKEKRPGGRYRAVVSPSEMARELGDFIGKKFSNDKKALGKSFVYWCYKNNIPICLPAPTDGAMGLHLSFFRQDFDLVLDAGADLKKFIDIANRSKKTGAIILGGGFAKHHTIGVNLLRGGLDYAVYVSTGTQYDGSMTGARTDEAVSWGKISAKARTAYVEGDATIIAPLLFGPFL